MNRDRRAPTRRPYRLCPPRGLERDRPPRPAPDAADVAPWLIADVRAWPATVEDRLVAVRMGVGVKQVEAARTARP